MGIIEKVMIPTQIGTVSSPFGPDKAEITTGDDTYSLGSIKKRYL